MTTTAIVLIAVRGMQRMDRVKMVLLGADMISKMLPSTHSIPNGNTISPALQFKDGERRMPSRVGYWAEIVFAICYPMVYPIMTNRCR